MRDGNHNLKIRLKTLSGFEYKPEITKSGSKLTVTDENGKILHEGEFKSFTANFMRLLYGNMIGGSTTACKSIVNGDVSPDTFPNVKINFAGGQGVQKFGIGVGNSSGAVGNTNYVLGWVSDLTYNNVVVSTPTVIGSTVKLDITREILNSSGSTKTLAEAGLIVGAEGEDDNNILMARDLVAVTLLNNQKSTWTYSITVDFSDLTGGFVKNFLDSLIKQWTQATANAGFSARYAHTSVVFDGKMWVIGGFAVGDRNDVWYSTDGTNWTQATANAGFSARNNHTSVVFDGKMWVIGGNGATGNLNDVWYSTDGTNWTQATANAGFSARNAHTSVVFDGKMWVIGGFDGGNRNDVWYSSDGVTWTQATSSAGFSGRNGHTSVVFDGKMWVIGGNDGTIRNDVWYSTDGTNWTQATANAGFTARRNPTSVVFDGKMWVIGGFDGGNRNDVWYSSDGVTWTQATANAGFSVRRAHTSVVFDSKMWVIGGLCATGNLKDVWGEGIQLRTAAIATSDVLGMIVGTSDSAFSATATALGTKIAHGTGAGQLEYGAFPDSAFTEEPDVSGNKTTMTLSRSFTNNSGGNITVKEVGITSVNGLLCRIVPETPIVIVNGATEVISIQFETEV